MPLGVGDCGLQRKNPFNSAGKLNLSTRSVINGVAFGGTLFFYFPRRALETFKKASILKGVDVLGAVLSIVGLTLL